MRRSAFLASALALPAGALAAKRAIAQDQFDPETSAASESLRVLLGAGDAQARVGGGFSFDGREYRGSFTRLGDGDIVNTLSLEEYVYSVVPREMPPSWPAAALQAQAICARTYVLQRSNPRRAYDVVPSEIDQVYGGLAAESPAGRAAVDATAAKVLRYAGGFAQIMYSSCCGGRTEASCDAWGGPPFPYLSSVACLYCTDSPQFHWQRTLDFELIESAFAQELAPFGALAQVRVSEQDGSGRARTMELQAERGSAFVKGSVFRLRIGPRVIPSLLIANVQQTGEQKLCLTGGGLGHGVGLCQWGARGFAQRGGGVSDILALYFPGTTIA